MKYSKYSVYQINADPKKTFASQERVSEAIRFGTYKGYNAEYADLYKRACVIEASSLEEVVKIGNIGPERKIKREGVMHGISVGDLIYCHDTDTSYSVDSRGFAETEFNIVEA